jgi:DUF1680 family protein
MLPPLILTMTFEIPSRRQPRGLALAFASMFFLGGSALFAMPPAPAVKEFPLGDVRLLDSRFKANMERNAAYLLSLEPDRFLHNTRLYAGLKPKGELYGGWEARGIAGHSLGHYLTALSQQYAATGDKRIKEKLDYTIAEMAECQKAYGDGYIGALPPLELRVLRELRDGKLNVGGGFNFGGAWVPWYTEHKILAGLKDAWVLGGNKQAKDVTLKLADWVDAVTAKLTPEQDQQMLGVEHGGMLETLVELYALTGNPRYLEVSKRFYHKAVLDPLAAGRDELPGKHANTQVPKVIGAAVTYEVTGDPDGRKIAENFWNIVTSKYTFAPGGNSDHEHFFPERDVARHLGPESAETCNVYNMLKLTEHLFEWKPEAAYGDYYERALYNQILASQEPKHGMFTYFQSLKPGHFRTYSTPTNSFWCCVGTGMENHTKYGEAIYFHGPNDLYVNLFIPSVLAWRQKGVLLEQRTDYPRGDTTTLTFQAAPATPLSLRVRCPGWAAGPLAFQLNGLPIAAQTPQPGGFATITRVWKKGDKLTVKIPMSLRYEPLEGAPDKIAFFYGPLLLAGDLGKVPDSATFPESGDHVANDRAPTADVPALVADSPAAALAAIHPVPGEPLTFRTEGIGHPEVTLKPYADLMYDYYNVYWDIFSPADWQKREAEREAEAAKEREEQARIVDALQPGEQQSEVDHALASDRSRTGDAMGRKWRDAPNGWFEFQMKVLPGVPQVLRATYWGGDAGRDFDILVDGKPLATQKLDRSKPNAFLDVDYPIPADLIAGKDKVTIRFQAKPGSIAGGIFSAKVLKAAK